MSASAWSSELESARRLAARGCFDEVLTLCKKIVQAHAGSTDALLDAGVLLLDCGLLSPARECFDMARRLAPGDPRPLANLAHACSQEADHAAARALYERLLQNFPDHPVIRRNYLTSLEYDPAASNAERYAAAVDWGRWAERRAGGPHPRPALRPLGDRPLRVGWVSADFCQHTAGLFAKDVLAALDPDRVESVAYSTGRVSDWVTKAFRKAMAFRDVAALGDQELASRIRNDDIDVLVDLSGHTAGSRLAVFAHRPAPVQVSWLGYFATTGLSCVDAVLLDEWHAPPEAEAFFTERIIRLPRGRLCYVPVPFAPEVSPPPHRCNGFITFGSFNNTGKLSASVLALWSRVLGASPDSRLVLKWRTFNDAGMRSMILDTFAAHGIDPGRIEPRGPSFHVDMLREYGDIDIALDSFPFTGGLTSCEALWMGLPVVTWPQDRVVSRQTHAMLSAVGLPELAAGNADEYVRLAVSLAEDRGRLTGLRQGMRGRMRGSALMDVETFARSLEDELFSLHRRTEDEAVR
ncbi:MAG: methyltransferase type 11 [Oceanidesulfovibrio sp.]